MTSLRRVALALLAAVSALVLAGCASPDAPAEVSFSASVATTCAGPLACSSFVSKSGSDFSGDLAWLESEGLVLSVTTRTGEPSLTITTPCNAITVPATISADRIQPDTDHLAAGAMSCAAPASEYEAWARQLVSRPLDYRLDGEDLVLENDTATLRLSRVPD
jgi:heat shock protein HslJ